jgi:hypothetical protein
VDIIWSGTQSINNGLSLQLSGGTGVDLDDEWTFTASSDSTEDILKVNNKTGQSVLEINTTNNYLMLGAYSTGFLVSNSAGLITVQTSIDINDDTNLQAENGVQLIGDTLSVSEIDFATQTNATASNGVDIVGNDIRAVPSEIDHDSLENYFEDDHINWTETNRSFNTTSSANMEDLTKQLSKNYWKIVYSSNIYSNDFTGTFGTDWNTVSGTWSYISNELSLTESSNGLYEINSTSFSFEAGKVYKIVWNDSVGTQDLAIDTGDGSIVLFNGDGQEIFYENVDKELTFISNYVGVGSPTTITLGEINIYEGVDTLNLSNNGKITANNYADTSITVDNNTVVMSFNNGSNPPDEIVIPFDSGNNITLSSFCPVDDIVWAEESGALSTTGATDGSGRQFSYGNGNAGSYGSASLCGGRIYAMTMDCENSASTVGRVQIAVNGVAQGSGCEVQTTGSNYLANTDQSCDINFNAGDQITPITTVSDATSNGCTVKWWMRYE